jgi:hypothetical protein
MRYLILSSLLLLSACTDIEGTIKVLESQGFKDIEITGYAFSGCGENDSYHTTFKACRDMKCINGIACKGLFKGITIRYY